MLSARVDKAAASLPARVGQWAPPSARSFVVFSNFARGSVGNLAPIFSDRVSPAR